MSGNGALLTAMRNFVKVVTSASMTGNRGFDKLWKGVEVVDAAPGRCVAAYKVKEDHVNSFGSMHGGVGATLVDTITTVALMDPETAQMKNPGVSVDLNVTYVNAAWPGDELLVDAQVIKSGKSLAFMECAITDRGSGKVILKGRHTKFVGMDRGKKKKKEGEATAKL